MEDEQIDLNIGLAEEERRDLEDLVSAFKVEQFSLPIKATPEDLQKQITFLKEKMASISVTLLKLDKKMHSLYEVTGLLYRKTKLMNESINDVIKIGKNSKQC